jgi:hypothetical protein
MTITARVLDFQNIGTAWRFVLDCEDDEPRGYGVDHLPAYPTRRDGVFRQRSHADASEPWFDERARSFEDALVARLDGEHGELELDDEELDEEAAALAVVDDVAVWDDDDSPVWAGVEWAEGDDPAEGLAKCEGLGHRAHREVPVLLRFAVGV